MAKDFLNNMLERMAAPAQLLAAAASLGYLYWAITNQREVVDAENIVVKGHKTKKQCDELNLKYEEQEEIYRDNLALSAHKKELAGIHVSASLQLISPVLSQLSQFLIEYIRHSQQVKANEERKEAIAISEVNKFTAEGLTLLKDGKPGQARGVLNRVVALQESEVYQATLSGNQATQYNVARTQLAIAQSLLMECKVDALEKEISEFLKVNREQSFNILSNSDFLSCLNMMIIALHWKLVSLKGKDKRVAEFKFEKTSEDELSEKIKFYLKESLSFDKDQSGVYALGLFYSDSVKYAENIVRYTRAKSELDAFDLVNHYLLFKSLKVLFEAEKDLKQKAEYFELMLDSFKRALDLLPDNPGFANAQTEMLSHITEGTPSKYLTSQIQEIQKALERAASSGSPGSSTGGSKDTEEERLQKALLSQKTKLEKHQKFLKACKKTYDNLILDITFERDFGILGAGEGTTTVQKTLPAMIWVEPEKKNKGGFVPGLGCVASVTEAK